MHKLLVSVHWFEFEDQFAICSSRWQMIETNFHFWIQTQFILKDYCWNPQLVEVAGPSSPDSQTRGMAFLLLSASATTESSEDHFKLQTKVIFSTRVKTERAETRGTEETDRGDPDPFFTGGPTFHSNNTCFWQFSSGNCTTITS